MSQWWNAPNALTLLRLLLVPAVVMLIIERRYSTALAGLLVAAATDALDGAIARHFGAITRTGAYLDPIADKILLSSVYISLAVTGSVPWWFVGVIFGRDFLLLASSGVVICLTGLRHFPPSAWGKTSTLFQITTALLCIAANVLDSTSLRWLARAFIWPTMVITIASGIHYGWRGTRLVRTH